MKITSQFLIICILILLSFFLTKDISAQDSSRVIRIAKLEIDSAKLENYKAMLKEEIETSVRVEPGVLILYAVYDKDHPAHVNIFEIYANRNAYESHRKTPHFIKYKTGTKDMVKSLELIEAAPIDLAAKKNFEY